MATMKPRGIDGTSPDNGTDEGDNPASRKS
jgi:hypothetical protein